MPTIVTVRQQAARRFRLLQERLVASSYNHRYRLAETDQRRGRTARPGNDGRWSLSPAQFCELLQVRSAAQVPAWAVLFPRVTGKPGTIELEQLPADEAAAQLTGALFRAHSSLKSAELFTSFGSGRSEGADLEHLCRHLTSRVRSFACHLGRDAYQSGASAEALVSQVIGGG
jgi:hypothetical protein